MPFPLRQRRRARRRPAARCLADAFEQDRGLAEQLNVAQHRWFALTSAAGYGDVQRSAVIDLGPVELADRLDWPAER